MAAPEETLTHEEKVQKLAFKVWNYKQGELVSMMIHLGDRLGLYRSLRDAGPVTAAELAERTGLKERWLFEWLRGQVAAGLLAYPKEDHFELAAEGVAVLADEDDSLAFAAGAFSQPPDPAVVDGVAEAFASGLGLSYQQLGPCAAHRTERMLGPWTRLALVPTILPALDGVVDRLNQGIDAIDVGCGGGVAVIAMAKEFPNTTFHGLDPSQHAIDLARQRSEEAGVENVVWHVARGEELPDEPTYDFFLTFDCVHDMTRPDRVIHAIKRSIRPDGTWLIKDIKSAPKFEDNFRNPMLAMLYGFSVSACMSSALSEPDGLGLGTLGFNPEVAQKMVREAGFGHFKMHQFEDPSNLYYEVRP